MIQGFFDDSKPLGDCRCKTPEFGLEILEPKDRAVVCRGQSTRVELSLEGDPPEGVVVHLYAGDRLVALRSAAPYVFDWVPDSVGDFLLRAVAFREDGTEVSSSPVRIGVSSTCFQVGLLPTAVPVVEKELIQDLLFEMGVGMHCAIGAGGFSCFGWDGHDPRDGRCRGGGSSMKCWAGSSIFISTGSFPFIFSATTC